MKTTGPSKSGKMMVVEGSTKGFVRPEVARLLNNVDDDGRMALVCTQHELNVIRTLLGGMSVLDNFFVETTTLFDALEDETSCLCTVNTPIRTDYASPKST